MALPENEASTIVRAHSLISVALLALQALWLDAAYPQVSDESRFREEASKQRAIYQGRGTARVEGYVIDRSLASYQETLASAFGSTLAGLGPQDRWLDIGAGEGQAILDYYATNPELSDALRNADAAGKASAVAVSIEDRRTTRWHRKAERLGDGKLQYLFGRPLREYGREALGSFQLITDVIGGFSYTSQLDRFVEKTLTLLTTGGSFFTLLQDVHSEEGLNRPHYEGSPFLTEITSAEGAEVKVCSWLKKIACVRVTCEIKMDWEPPIEIYHVHKICDDVRVPALTRVHYAAGTPPERRFVLSAPTPDTASSEH